MKYSPSTKGFYYPKTKGIPADAVDLSMGEYAELIEAQESGKIISQSENGKPTAIERDAETWESLRIARNQKLSDSDWTQLPDAPVDREAWAAYRQALRDMPDTQPDASSVVWPAKP